MKGSIGANAIHRRLTIRLLIAGTVIGAVMGVAVWIFQHNRINDNIIETAHHGVELLNDQVRPYLDAEGSTNQAALQRRLNSFAAHALRSSAGRFVAVRIYSMRFEALAHVEDSAYKHYESIRRLMAEMESPHESMDIVHTKIVTIAQRPHIQIMAPLSNRLSKPAAYVVAVYALSIKATNAIQHNTVKAVLSVIGIVILITSLLYPVIVTLLSQVSKTSTQLLESHIEILKLLGSAIAKKDSETDLHNYRVTIIAVRLAEACDFGPTAIQSLIKGAFLHDVGKLAVPDAILRKKGRLNRQEMRTMQGHVRHGLDILKRSTWLSDTVPIVGYHHEKYNGDGYCSGLKGRGIPKAARVFAIADVFDALTSKRHYKKAYSFNRTMTLMIEKRGRHFDPGILDRFIPIAKGLYEQLTISAPDELEAQVRKIIDTYFLPEKIIMAE